MKKTCDGCKAYVCTSKTEYCSKHYETYLQETRIKGLYILSPAEPCPKPRTYKALINTPKKRKKSMLKVCDNCNKKQKELTI